MRVTNSLGFSCDGVMIEQKTGLAAATVANGVHFDGSTTGANYGCSARNLRMSNGGGNPVITGQPVKFTGSNYQIDVEPWGYWTYDGSGSEPAPTTLPTSRPAAPGRDFAEIAAAPHLGSAL